MGILKNMMIKHEYTDYYHITEFINNKDIDAEEIFRSHILSKRYINIDISKYYYVSDEDLSKLRFKKSEDTLIKMGAYDYINADGIYYKKNNAFIEFDFHNKNNIVQDKYGNYHVLYYNSEKDESNIINLSNIKKFLMKQYKTFLINDRTYDGRFITIGSYIRHTDINTSCERLESVSDQLKILHDIATSKDIEYLNSLISVTLKS